MNNRNLFACFVICAGMLAACSSLAQKTDLPVQEFEKAIGQANIQLLDVRTAGEYQSGHLANALLADWTNKPEFERRIKSLDKSKPVYTYCLSGARSGQATQWLRENGFSACNLAGGIAAWKRDNKPVEQAVPVKQITMAEYLSQIPANKTVLVDVGAVWCPPCKKMAPVIDSLVAQYGSAFQLVKIDGGEQTEICKQLGIDAFPEFIIYKQGKITWRKQGLVTLKELSGQL